MAGSPARSRAPFLERKDNLALAMRDYELRPYSGNATLFIAQDQPDADAEPERAWAGKILGGCEIQIIPGTHQYDAEPATGNFTRP